MRCLILVLILDTYRGQPYRRRKHGRIGALQRVRLDGSLKDITMKTRYLLAALAFLPWSAHAQTYVQSPNGTTPQTKIPLVATTCYNGTTVAACGGSGSNAAAVAPGAPANAGSVTYYTAPNGNAAAVTPTQGLPVTQNPISTTPSGGNYTVTTTATTAIPASSSRLRVGYQLQGTGYACASWVTATITISSNTAAATCTGAGAFLVTAGTTYNSTYPLTNNTAFSIIGATASALVLAYDAQ